LTKPSCKNADSIRQHGLIQPITVRLNNKGFEIVAGARRYRASLLAGQFSIPSRIVELTDAQSLEWALVENSQRVDDPADGAGDE
jgi:ParB family chromosome partitioning protein